MDHAELKATIAKLKAQIIKIEAGSTQLSETDTRQGLINPLFRALGWDFTDFELVKSEVRIPAYNEPVDYAFYAKGKKAETPILLLEAKRLGRDLGHKDHVKQLTSYLGAMGVQWGILSDGNRYVLYNSRGGVSFDDQKFLVLEIKTVDTDSGFTMDEFAKHLVTLLSRECLQNDQIQQAYEHHMINSKIRVALDSLLSEPFDTLVASIRREFSEERVGLPAGITISKKHIETFLKSISDESGRIPVDAEAEAIHSNDSLQDSVAESTEQALTEVPAHGKRISIGDLLSRGLVHAGDQWRMVYKGEVSWGRIESSGQIEVNGRAYGNPSKAAVAVAIGKAQNGWYSWQYRDDKGEWHRIEALRQRYRESGAPPVLTEVETAPPPS